MKIKKIPFLRSGALIALGVFLGRGAQADTILDFQVVPAGQPVNGPPGILQTFGDNVAASSDGITVVGFGTPNIGLTWTAGGAADARWDYYNDIGTYDVWGGVGQLNDSELGTFHGMVFTPNSASARVVVKSFKFFPYYISSERFTYDVSVLAGTNVVSGPTNITFLSDQTKNHPVSINYTGAPGQTLKLRIARVASTLGGGEVEGGAYNIAVDDITFGQLPETTLPSGPQVVSVTPDDGQTGVPAVYYPYLASITNGDTTLTAASIKLRLDGSLVSPPPTVSSSGGLTNVSYLGTALLSTGSHAYTLTYDDNLGASYTNEVQFTVAYTTLSTAYALPRSAGLTNGFTCRTVSASSEAVYLDSTIARAIAQLNGTLINTNTGLPYTNSATLGTNADGYFDIDTVLNFNDYGPVAGNFPDDQPFPGLDTGMVSDWFSTEALLYLDLPAGYYRLGVNSDDGFEVNALPPQGVPGAPLVVGLFDNGRGAADTLFDVLVPTGGIYPFQLIYFEVQGYASCEFFSVTNLATGGKLLINDPAPDAVKSFRVLKPRLTRISRSGPNVAVEWAYGTPPFQVQVRSNLTTAPWINSGAPTTSRSATVPVQPGSGFIRVGSQ